jgi:hypothetical protein
MEIQISWDLNQLKLGQTFKCIDRKERRPLWEVLIVQM